MSEEKIARQVQTIAIFLGPYRNLTTLVTSIMASHPQCLALNHALERIFADPRLDFFSTGNVEQFLTAAIRVSKTGSRGSLGGDIWLSHAFDDEAIRRLYNKYADGGVFGAGGTCLIWKDSMRVSNHIMRLGLNAEDVAKRDARFRFLLPIRNPLDCAQANLANQFRFLTDRNRPTKLDLLQRILSIVREISLSATALPGAFFVFTQSEMQSQDFWDKLCLFLRVSCPKDWRCDASRTVDVRPGYAHSAEEIEVYRNLVLEIFEEDAGMRERLLKLA